MTEKLGETGRHQDEFPTNSTGAPQMTRFRFKEKPRPSSDQCAHSHYARKSWSSHGGYRRHSSHNRSKRRKTSSTGADNPATCGDSIHTISPEAAFRESLFDAMADDEGAMFWESVYGQPIHNYPKTYVNQRTGKLEQMDDEEYAEYVRRKMWEKSWEGIEAERKERRRAQKAKRSQEEKGERRSDNAGLQNKRIFDLEVEESLKRGEERRERKRWKTLWNDYLQSWARLQQIVDEKPKDSEIVPQTFLQEKIFWPVESGKRDDLLPANIETFILNATKHSSPHPDWEAVLPHALKTERVRWHPDKIQQRFGSLDIDKETMKGVTAVFQVIDRMWTERKGKH